MRAAGAVAVRVLAVVAVGWSLLLLVDDRHRDLPVADFLIPALGLPLLGWLAALRAPGRRLGAFAAGGLFRAVRPGRPPRFETWIGGLLMAAAVLTLLLEGVLPTAALLRGIVQGTSAAPLDMIDWTSPNREALAWAAEQALMALPFLAAARSSRAFRGGMCRAASL